MRKGKEPDLYPHLWLMGPVPDPDTGTKLEKTAPF